MVKLALRTDEHLSVVYRNTSFSLQSKVSKGLTFRLDNVILHLVGKNVLRFPLYPNQPTLRRVTQ